MRARLAKVMHVSAFEDLYQLACQKAELVKQEPVVSKQLLRCILSAEQAITSHWFRLATAKRRCSRHSGGAGRHDMAKRAFLTAEQLADVLGSFPSDHTVSVVRIRYKNRQEIRSQESFRLDHLRAFIQSCMSERHQPGGDLELEIPALDKGLVGHHDGLYWLETCQRK